jgi:hypothetical protein
MMDDDGRRWTRHTTQKAHCIKIKEKEAKKMAATMAEINSITITKGDLLPVYVSAKNYHMYVQVRTTPYLSKKASLW